MAVFKTLLNHGNRRIGRFAIATAFVLTLTGPVQAQCHYDVTLIHAPVCPGGGLAFQPITAPRDLSETGVVVGHYERCDFSARQEAFYWTEETGLITLVRPAQFDSIQAMGVSPNGRYIVGYGNIPGLLQTWSVIWTDGAAEIIQPTGDSYAIEALAVNDARVIVGRMRDPSPKSQDYVPFRIANQSIVVLTTSYDDRGWARDVNAGSIATGHSGLGGIASIATIWYVGSPILLPASPNAIASGAIVINENNIAGGAENIPDSQGTPSKPMIWRNDMPIQLPLGLGARVGVVLDIADYDVSVGIIGGDNSAPIWIDKQVHELNDLINDSRINEIYEAVSIDHRGVLLARVNVWIGSVNGVVSALLTPINSSDADLNRDCTINSLDIQVLFGEWNQNDSFADIDKSGVVDVFDLFVLLSDWG